MNFTTGQNIVPSKAKWFDKECIAKKKSSHKLLNKLNRINPNLNATKYQKVKQDYLNSRIDYKKTVRDKKKQYNKESQETLVENRHNGKAFWNFIKKLSFSGKKNGKNHC